MINDKFIILAKNPFLTQIADHVYQLSSYGHHKSIWATPRKQYRSTEVNYLRINKITNHGYNGFDKTKIRELVFGFSIICKPG